MFNGKVISVGSDPGKNYVQRDGKKLDEISSNEQFFWDIPSLKQLCGIK